MIKQRSGLQEQWKSTKSMRRKKCIKMSRSTSRKSQTNTEEGKKIKMWGEMLGTREVVFKSSGVREI